MAMMTVRALIEKLQDLDPDRPVHIGYDYGDHIHTTVCPTLRTVEEEQVRWSEYHRMPRLVDADDDEKADDKLVVVLR